MKIAVVYYSFDGNTETAAREVAKVLSADLFAIETKKALPRGFLTYIFGGKQVIFKENPEIGDLSFNPDAYDKIILGAPCWAGNIAPAMKTFLQKYQLKNKEIALLLCHAGGAKDKTFEKWKKNLDASNKVVAEKKMFNPKKFQPARSLSVVGNWAQDIWERETTT